MAVEKCIKNNSNELPIFGNSSTIEPLNRILRGGRPKHDSNSSSHGTNDAVGPITKIFSTTLSSNHFAIAA